MEGRGGKPFFRRDRVDFVLVGEMVVGVDRREEEEEGRETEATAAM